MIDRKNLLSVFLSIAVLIAPASAFAQEHDDEIDTGHGEELHNSLELFLGATRSDGDNNFSVGAIYEHRFNHARGMGGVAEYTPEEGTWVLVVPFFVHPVEPWRLNIGPGVEMHGGEKEFLFRLGGSYEFVQKNWAVAPEVNFDLVDGDVNVVFGFGIRWKHRLIRALEGL